MSRDDARRTESARPLRLVSNASTPDEAPDHPARWSRPEVRTVAIASGRGGVGKSNLAANLAVVLGEAGARVLLLDADFAQASLDLLLGLHPRYDLQDVLSGERTIEEIVVDGPQGVRLVPAASNAPELADLDDFRRESLLRSLGNIDAEVDLVLIDTASGLSHQMLQLCLAADDVVVLTTSEIPAFSDAYGLIKMLHAQGTAHAPHLVVSMANTGEEAEETANRIRLVARRFLQMEIAYWGHVPFDAAVSTAVRRQEPVVTAYPNSPAASAYRALARKLWGPTSPADTIPVPIEERLRA